MIKMKHCLFEYTPEGARTYILGHPVEAHPHHTPHYHVIAHRCGYGDDVMAYCREHEFCHNFVE